jgi:Domain of unknown function (DUF4209)
MSEAGRFPRKEDFEARPWNEVIEAVSEKTRFTYCNQFCAKALQQNDESQRELWKYLARITSFEFDFDAPDGIFGSRIDAISEQDIELTKELILLVEDPELKARMADLVWSKQHKGNFHCVGIAVEAYLESAIRLEHPENWVLCEDRIRRAYNLAFSVNNPAIAHSVIDHIKGVLSRCNGEDPLFLSARMMHLLLEREETDTSTYILLAEKLARRAESSGKHYIAREYWVIKARWHDLAGEEEASRAASIAAAETHIAESEGKLKQTAAPYLHAIGDLEGAIKALRQIPGTQERVREIHRRLLEYQRHAVGELAHFESERIDLTTEAEKARRKVEGRSFQDALFVLSVMLKPTSFVEAKRAAEQSANDFRLLSLFGSTRMNSMGRVIARLPSLMDNSPEEAEEALRGRMLEQSSRSWQLYAFGVIDPARRQIVEEHTPRVRDFSNLVANSPFVPPGREGLYARGLHAGLIGDFAGSMHFLIPQLEHSIRCLMYENAAIASSIDPDGIQHEFDLNTLLKTSKHSQVLVNILGEDTVFDLRGIFVDANGANLRNEMAHGLIDSHGFHSFVSLYAWWMVLRLCCIPVLNRLQDAEK